MTVFFSNIVLNLYYCDSSPITTACFKTEITSLLSGHICSSPFADCKWETFFKHINIGHSWWVKCFWITSDGNEQLPHIQKGTQQNEKEVSSWELPCFFQKVAGWIPYIFIYSALAKNCKLLKLKSSISNSYKLVLRKCRNYSR